jgi:anhydro-N-acetylmuramic acid kinase
MYSQVVKLAQIANKPERQIIGLMSGTSLDGLDVAWCVISGQGNKAKIRLHRFHTEPYSDEFRREVRRVFARKEIDFQHLVLLNVLVAETQAAMVNRCLNTWNTTAADIDLIASHGQTVFHAPRVFHGMAEYPNATLQIGDGDHIARRTGIITISDFRQKHVAAGGEGAPLALFGDYYLFSSAAEDRILLNIGGIANFTWLPRSGDPNAVFATDTGPGNTLLDAFAQQLFQVPFDANGQLAANGIVDIALLNRLKQEPFFAQPFPKTIGPELFSPAWVETVLAAMPKGMPAHNPYNLMATLTRLTAETIAEAIQRAVGQAQPVIYLSGGGAHNSLVISGLKELLPNRIFQPMQHLGIDGDAKEAALFAMLANECVAGQIDPKMRLGGVPLVSMGKISFPN